MNWALIEATDSECTMDESGVYTMIHRAPQGDGTIKVRADLMREEDDEPVVSFIGTANNVRRKLIGWIHRHWPVIISTEHASYLGYELLRAETEEDYVQD